MAISWGPWASGAGGVRTRLGVEWSQSPSTIRSSTSSVTVTCRIYLRHSGFVQDSNFQLILGGSFSGTTTHSVNRSGSGTVLLRTTSRSYAPIVGQRGHSALTARLSAFIGGSPSLTSNYYSPAKPGGGTPQTRPAAPTGAIVTRISNTEIRLVWNIHPTSNAPYTGVKIERWDVRFGTWGQVAAGGSASQSWTDTTTYANNAFRYRVRAYNSVGHSLYSEQSALVMNTPGAPGNVVARRIGSDVHLTWTNGARQGAFTSTEIQHRADGGAWTVIGTGFGASREDYLHESPSGGGTHQYRIRARADSLLGPWSDLSNVVAIESPPNAPTNLTPGSGQYVPDTGQVQLSWRHNPTDGSDQTRAVVRYGPSAASLTTVNVNGDAQTTLIPAPSSGTGGQELLWYWDVQTYGSHASPSPRTSVNPYVIGTPSTEILSPADGETYEASTLVVQWKHVGIPGATQTGYRVNFYRAGVLLGQASGSGSLNTWMWDGRLTDTETYTVTVQTRDMDSGLWTAVASSEFTVDLLKPPTPDILAGWVPDEGVVNITVNNSDAGEGEAEVIGFELWRATDAETIRAAEEWERSLTARQDAMTEAAGKVAWVEQVEEPAGDANLLWIDGDGSPNVWADSGPGWMYAGDDVVQAGDDAAAGAVGVRATLDALWEQHAVKVSSVGVDESITDHAPPVGVPVAYRVLASSAIPSVAVSETLLTSTTPHHTWIWLNAGEGWGESIKMRRGGNIKVSHVQEKVRVQYKGRRRRVEYLGDAVEDRVTVNVRLDEEDGSCSFDELIDMLDRPAPLLYRDPTGRMWEVSSDATTLDHHARLKYVTFDLERTDG